MESFHRAKQTHLEHNANALSKTTINATIILTPDWSKTRDLLKEQNTLKNNIRITRCKTAEQYTRKKQQVNT